MNGLQQLEEGSGLPLWRRPLTAMVVGLGILCLALIPQIADVLLAIDHIAAVQLNRIAGRSPVLDYMIRFIADDDGVDRLLVAMLITMGVFLWRSANAEIRARRLSTFLYVFAFTGGALILNEYMEDVVGRRGPSLFLKPFRNVEALYDWNIDLTEKHSFPSVEGLLFYLPGFILLRLGARRSAHGFLAAGSLLPLGRCVFGTTWITDIYLGAAPLAYLLSAVAVETPVFNFRQWLEDRITSLYDQWTMLLPRWKPILTDGRRTWNSQNVFAMEVAVKRYVAEELPRLLQAGEKGARRAIQMEVPLGGLQSIVRVITVGDHKVVLRAYPLTRRQWAERHRAAAELLTSHGIRVPVIHAFVDERRKYGCWFLVEEFVEGTCPRAQDLTDEQIQAAATELARMHKVVSSRWGAVDAERSEGYADVILRRVSKRLTASRATGGNADDAKNRQKILAWFRSWRPLLENLTVFHLIHGKLHRENAIFGSDGRYCLLDNTTIEWGMPAEDLVAVHTSLCEGDSDIIAKFDHAYFAQLPPEMAAMQKKLVPFFEAFMVLSHLNKYSKRMGRRTGKQKDAMGTQRLRAQVSLLDLVENLPPPGE